MRANFIGLVSGLAIIGCTMAQADGKLTEDFSKSPETRWDYVADTVMGGVSSGQVQFSSEGNVAFARLIGTVSTENNGGFIQFRHKLPDRPDASVSGVRLLVRGNGEQYFVHLRTRGTVLPWQYYQAEFPTSDEWTEVSLPLSGFKASGAMLRAIPVADEITSVGVVAYGRDHEARVDVSEIGFY
ncbi:CIA30 family protein [Ruegeria atlantica]|uniref:Complex I intermediate-associated protein 30 (CIA30) n=1 Tax=Ruegeria atlantica TaxID=81569 RepID=A0A0P1EF84_9RHOB|nr:CIA30 family protein [Ruegeria atlantica]CUH48721.1 Complex I intermediate-associated protein 30 (CIA30) [Ruegeria atlantica]